VPFVNTSEATEKIERPNRERQMYKYAGLSTLVNLCHTEHDPPDVIGLDNNTAMLYIRDSFLPVP